MPLEYPRRLRLAQTPTPLQFLERASARWGGGHRLWVKRDDLTGCALSGNKVRKLEFIAAHAIDNGYDTLDRVDRGLDQFSALPMFIGWGLRDFVFDKHFLKEWQTRFPDAELYRFEDAGHYVLEDAVEDIVPLIRRRSLIYML